MIPTTLTSVTLMIVFTLAVAAAAPAEPATQPAATGAAGMVERSYDISDLLIPIPDFTDAPDFNRPANAPPSRVEPATQPSAAEMMNQLVAWMSETLAPTGGEVRGDVTHRTLHV